MKPRAGRTWSPVTSARVVHGQRGRRQAAKLYVREVDVGFDVGFDKYNNMAATSVMTVMTVMTGELVTAFAGKLDQ